MTDNQFCPHCEVSNDLHNGPDTCDSADAKARLLESFNQLIGHR